MSIKIHKTTTNNKAKRARRFFFFSHLATCTNPVEVAALKKTEQGATPALSHKMGGGELLSLSKHKPKECILSNVGVDYTACAFSSLVK